MRALILVTGWILCACTTVLAFADPLEEVPNATDGHTGSANFDSEKFAGDVANQFTKRMEEAFEAVEARKIDEEIRKINSSPCVAPSNGSILNAEDFKKAVGCALSKTVPYIQGIHGYAAVRFVVLEGGGLKDLEVDQSSGDTEIDQSALMAVRKADIPDPPEGLSLADRTFRVQYVEHK